MTIKAVTFDFWSTLYKGRTVDYTKRLLALKESVEQFSGATFHMEQFKDAVKVARDAWNHTWAKAHRTITADEWLEIMLNELGTSLRPRHLQKIQFWMENSVLHEPPTLAPEAKSVLANLSTRYRLAIISDTGITPGRVLRQILQQDGISRYFTCLTFSDEIGLSKPHPDAFLTTLAALEAAPAEAVHVGDLLRTDIAGAQAVGMRAVQYIGITRGEQWGSFPDESPEIVPDAVIESHTELTSLLQQWNGTQPQ